MQESFARNGIYAAETHQRKRWRPDSTLREFWFDDVHPVFELSQHFGRRLVELARTVRRSEVDGLGVDVILSARPETISVDTRKKIALLAKSTSMDAGIVRMRGRNSGHDELIRQWIQAVYDGTDISWNDFLDSLSDDVLAEVHFDERGGIEFDVAGCLEFAQLFRSDLRSGCVVGIPTMQDVIDAAAFDRIDDVIRFESFKSLFQNCP